MSTATKSTVKARKAHRCTLCGFVIPAGEEYHYARVGPMDHPDNEGFLSIYVHLDCMAMWSEVGNDCDWIFPDSPWDFIEIVTNAGLAEPCATCDGSGQIHETEGNPRPPHWSIYREGKGQPFPWIECITCEGRGYSSRRPARLSPGVA
jgi:hypothetical protein